MYELVIERPVSVTHAVRLYDGEHEPVHGHAWRVEVHVESPVLDAIGAVMDMFLLDRLLAEAMADLEGRFVNEVPALRDTNSTSERMAELVFHRLLPGVTAPVVLRRVVVIRDELPRARFSFVAPVEG